MATGLEAAAGGLLLGTWRGCRGWRGCKDSWRLGWWAWPGTRPYTTAHTMVVYNLCCSIGSLCKKRLFAGTHHLSLDCMSQILLT